MDPSAKQKTCQRCGAEFGCCVGGKCWCGEEPYRLPMPKPVEAKYDDCLCRACLRDVAEEAGWRPEDGFEPYG